MFKENFTSEELNMARKNGFILSGKTGAGKSTLLNVLFEEEVAEARKDAKAVTTKSEVYYLKLKNGKYISLVDTPGLSDPKIVCQNQTELDNIYLKDIEKKVSNEKINVKGILFLVNFQSERFDASEQEALLNYNKLFPLKKFWQHLIVVFTHNFADPDGDSVEEMKESRDKSNCDIFTNLMQKIKNISDVIDYRELRTKYYNSYSPVKNKKQKIKNNKNKIDLENLIKDLCEKPPLFCHMEILSVKNQRMKENNKLYLVTYEIIGYFDLNHKPLKTIESIVEKKEITENEIVPPTSHEITILKPEQPKPSEPVVINPKPPKKPEDSYFLKYKSEIGLGAGGLLGAGLGVAGGLAYVGGIAAGVGIKAAIVTGAAAAGSVIAAPVAKGIAAVGGVGALIGWGISKLFGD